MTPDKKETWRDLTHLMVPRKIHAQMDLLESLNPLAPEGIIPGDTKTSLRQSWLAVRDWLEECVTEGLLTEVEGQNLFHFVTPQPFEPSFLFSERLKNNPVVS